MRNNFSSSLTDYNSQDHLNLTKSRNLNFKFERFFVSNKNEVFILLIV